MEIQKGSKGSLEPLKGPSGDVTTVNVDPKANNGLKSFSYSIISGGNACKLTGEVEGRSTPIEATVMLENGALPGVDKLTSLLSGLVDIHTLLEKTAGSGDNEVHSAEVIKEDVELSDDDWPEEFSDESIADRKPDIADMVGAPPGKFPTEGETLQSVPKETSPVPEETKSKTQVIKGRPESIDTQKQKPQSLKSKIVNFIRAKLFGSSEGVKTAKKPKAKDAKTAKQPKDKKEKTSIENKIRSAFGLQPKHRANKKEKVGSETKVDQKVDEDEDADDFMDVSEFKKTPPEKPEPDYSNVLDLKADAHEEKLLASDSKLIKGEDGKLRNQDNLIYSSFGGLKEEEKTTVPKQEVSTYETVQRNKDGSIAVGKLPPPDPEEEAINNDGNPGVEEGSDPRYSDFPQQKKAPEKPPRMLDKSMDDKEPVYAQVNKNRPAPPKMSLPEIPQEGTQRKGPPPPIAPKPKKPDVPTKPAFRTTGSKTPVIRPLYTPVKNEEFTARMDQVLNELKKEDQDSPPPIDRSNQPPLRGPTIDRSNRPPLQGPPIDRTNQPKLKSVHQKEKEEVEFTSNAELKAAQNTEDDGIEFLSHAQLKDLEPEITAEYAKKGKKGKKSKAPKEKGKLKTNQKALKKTNLKEKKGQLVNKEGLQYSTLAFNNPKSMGKWKSLALNTRFDGPKGDDKVEYGSVEFNSHKEPEPIKEDGEEDQKTS